MQKRKRFGEILVEAKVVDESTLTQALQRQKGTGRRLGQVLEDMGVVTEKDIAAALARQFGFKTVSNIVRASFSPEVLSLVDAKTAMHKLIFPLKVDAGILSLAMVNPLDIETIDSLSFKSQLRVVSYVTTPSEIQAAVNRHYYGLEAERSHEPDHWWTILVVEDQEMARATILAALKREGYNLCEAENGAEGIKMAIQQRPHLVIADTVMPRMDGYEMFRALKGNLLTKHIPVIALSSKSSPEEEAKLLDMGYHDFIAKPINAVRLVARVKRTLRMTYGDSPPPR